MRSTKQPERATHCVARQQMVEGLANHELTVKRIYQFIKELIFDSGQ